MSLAEAIRVLVLGAGRDFPVLDVQGLRTLFPQDGEWAFHTGLQKLAKVGLLERVGRGLYLNKAAPHMGGRGIGVVARHLRPGHLCYLSYESALAEFGSISQVPMLLTIATTGKSGRHSTAYGALEFCQTSRGDLDILDNTEFDEGLGLRVASPVMAYEDLRRVRPCNLHLVDEEDHAEAVAEWENPAWRVANA